MDHNYVLTVLDIILAYPSMQVGSCHNVLGKISVSYDLLESKQLLFPPNHFIDDADIGLDDLHDLIGNVFVGVVGDGDRAAVLFLANHLDGGIDGLKESFRVDAGEDEAGFIECFWAFR